MTLEQILNLIRGYGPRCIYIHRNSDTKYPYSSEIESIPVYIVTKVEEGIIEFIDSENKYRRISEKGELLK